MSAEHPPASPRAATNQAHQAGFGQAGFGQESQRYPYYSGPLGVVCDPAAQHAGAEFYLWAPTAESVTLRLWRPQHPLGEPAAGAVSAEPVEYAMRSGVNGSWQCCVETDVWGWEYDYQLRFNDAETTAVDPYATAVTANGARGVVADPALILPPVQRAPSFGEIEDVVIYEAHVRDLTIGPDNGITHKGMFLGLTEQGTRTEAGQLSGLDYLASLGVTHIQLLPVSDFATVDETGDRGFNAQYNWGYDPAHYNVPEGSYSTDPTDPTARIREFRALVDALHSRGLRVVMDVVYNHVFDAAQHPFQRTVPGYFFRTDAEGRLLDGSFCGNETASERAMVRRYIVDSLCHWARTYGVDGFRLDLMGLHDVATINAVRAALDEIDPSILVLGEGWEMGNHPPEALGANQSNARLLPRVAMFNDTFRDVIKGGVFHADSRGFISGGGGGHSLIDAHLGARASRCYLSAAQSVVYNEAHDNLTLYDKLLAAGVDDPARRHALAIEIQLLSRGVMFLHAGQEFCRTKHGVDNSYNSPDEINVFDYDRAAAFGYMGALVRGLLRLRREHAWLRESDYAEIAARTAVLHCSDDRLAYVVRGAFGDRGSRRAAMVVINGSEEAWVPGTNYGLPPVEALHLHEHSVHRCDAGGADIGELSIPRLSVSLVELVDDAVAWPLGLWRG
ncbi:Pullulanase [Corynebacterium ciconiae DSM 44920]|uniref:type I pullulanase n=1 Tax=Corynebacterium ciconiae TaxID=227319 RepID=UPI00142F0891|nr:type I pullulanase [Corynebacterium ciconiae]WKD60360.1 Pullulanase [Corynebacterium ciconiae DSM 44920]